MQPTKERSKIFSEPDPNAALGGEEETEMLFFERFEIQGAYHGIPICLLFPRRFVSGSLSLNIYERSRTPGS